MSQNTFPIVGAYYRPPAKALIDVLAVGTPIILMAEPDNPADPNAIAVWLYSKDIPEGAHERLRETLEPYGSSLEAVLNEEMWHIGYIPKDFAAALRANGTVGDEPIQVSFSVSTSGAPRVRFEEAPL